MANSFQKRVERTTVRQLNVLYSIDRYDKANVISAAKDSVSAFKLSNGGSQGFSTEHALYYMSALFKDPPPDSVVSFVVEMCNMCCLPSAMYRNLCSCI